MNIKCPFCPKIFDDDMRDLLGNHIMNHSKIELAVYVNNKLIQIHKKLEGLKDGRLLIHQPLTFTHDILTSLLDDLN